MYRSSQVHRTSTSRTSRTSESRPKPRTEYRQTRSSKPFMVSRSSSKAISSSSSRPSSSHQAAPKGRVDRFMDRMEKKVDRELEKQIKTLAGLNRELLDDVDNNLDPFRTTKHSTTRTRDLRGAKQPLARRIRNIERQMEGLSKSSSQYRDLKAQKRVLTTELGELQIKSMDPRLPRIATHIDDNVMPNLRKNQREFEDFLNRLP